MTVEPLLSIPLWSMLGACALGTALLWVAASVADEAASLGTSRSGQVGLVATALATAALWWIAHQGHAPQGATHDSRPMILLTIFGGLAVHASRAGARSPVHDKQHLLGIGGTVLAGIACAVAAQALPGQGLSLGSGAVLMAGLLLAAALKALHLPMARGARARGRRGLAATAAAAGVLALTYRTPVGAAAIHGLSWLPMVLLLGLGSYLLMALRQLRRQRNELQSAGGSRATVDALTGLPNRASLEARLTKALAASAADRQGLALITVNLDGFKPVNVSFGHAMGDQLLKQAAQRLRRLTPEGGVLARPSADEFVLVVPELPNPAALEKLAKAIIDAIAQPFLFGTREVVLTCSVGVALHPEHGDGDKLLARSELALQAAKHAGGARVSFYDASMEGDLAADLELLRDFRHALEHDQLALVFQPKIEAASGQITAAEALLRWRHPTRGDVPPTAFVALAERFGLVARLGDWVIEHACRQARIWADRGLNMRVAINLSAQHMRQPDLARRIRSVLERYRIDPARLTCEITETLAMENTQATQATFAQLGEVGVHISIDDFGTGYSSLAYLRSLPASEVKIDRSFVMDLERSADARAVVDAVVKLAHALGKRVVAEGVESVRQRRILTEMHCDELQGFLFAHPMAPGDLLDWAIEARNRDDSAFRASLYVGSDAAERHAEGRDAQPAATPLH